MAKSGQSDGRGGGSSEGPDQSDAGGDAPWRRRISRGGSLVLPLITLACVVVIVVSFHAVLLPFVLACAIVYLMEPIVRRMSPRLPRWAAVILVYVGFFGVLTLGVLFVVPRFVSEIGRFAETVPQTVAEFRDDHLPGINDQVQRFLKNYIPQASEGMNVEPARRAVRDARRNAASRAAATAVARSRVQAAADIDITIEADHPPEGSAAQAERTYTVESKAAAHHPADWDVEYGQWTRLGASRRPVIRLRPTSNGEFEVFLGGGQVEVTRVDDQVWRVQRDDGDDSADGADLSMGSMVNLDLEARLNDMIEGMIDSSHDRLMSAIGYARTLLVGVFEALVAIILTFMVAAFISMDLPRVMKFIRQMVPADYRPGYDELRGRVDRGLAGVIRGQLFICVINGALTYVGLAILGIKFTLLLAVVAGVLSLIPIFGTIISTIPIVIIGLMNGLITGLLALLWVLGIHFLEANILNPQIIGTSAHIHPVIVIFALLAGESTFGLVGALLAVPVASILLELFKFLREKLSVDPPADEPTDGSTAR